MYYCCVDYWCTMFLASDFSSVTVSTPEVNHDVNGILVNSPYHFPISEGYANNSNVINTETESFLTPNHCIHQSFMNVEPESPVPSQIDQVNSNDEICITAVCVCECVCVCACVYVCA